MGPCSQLHSGTSIPTHVSIPSLHPILPYHPWAQPGKPLREWGAPAEALTSTPAHALQVPPASGSQWWRWLPQPPLRAAVPTTASGAPRAPPAPPAAWHSAQPRAWGGLPASPCPTGDRVSTSWEPPATNLSQEPNTCTQSRTEHALCTCPSSLPHRLVASGDSTLKHLGISSPHFTELSNPGGSGIQLQGTRETRHHCVHPHCCRSLNCCLQLDPALMNWAGWEVRTPDTPIPSQSHLHLAPVASSPARTQLWWGKEKLRGTQLGRLPR